jgi:hypothetical protein
MHLTMPIKILQANVGRAYAAHDLAHATAIQHEADILVLSEPNRKRVETTDWPKDTRTNVAVLILNKSLQVSNHTSRDGYIVIKLRNLSMVCCYVYCQ